MQIYIAVKNTFVGKQSPVIMTGGKLLQLLGACALLAFSAGEELKWWQKGVIYQIYPRSFKDSNNDGVGDLPGITSKLEYLSDLGVAAVWLSPIYVSPMKDFGYDIANFTDIDPIFGTLDDFDKLIAQAKSLGLRVIMDFVPNHTSDLHQWFQDSVDKVQGFEDFFVWRDPKGFNDDGTPIPPNNWISEFYGPAWQWNDKRQQFYFHQFAVGQPDLNYRNPAVVQAMKDVISFWLDRGVDGFRVDAIPSLFEDTRELDEPLALNNVTNDPNNYNYLEHIYSRDQPETYDMVKQWRQLLDDRTNQDKADRCIMVEMYGTIERTMAFYGTKDAPIAHFPFNFQLIPANDKLTARDYKAIIDEWTDNVPEWAWSNWVLGNHDNHRIGSRVGEDLRDAMNILSLSLPGTAVTYYGEEIGMLDNLDISYDDGVDPSGCNYPPELWYQRSRDFERTPFQWDSSPNAGFNEGKQTWLPIHDNYKEINLEAERNDTRSHYNVYKTLVNDVRNRNAWANGRLNVQTTSGNTLAILRSVSVTDYYVTLINFGSEAESIDLSGIFLLDGQTKLNVVVSSGAAFLSQGDSVVASQVTLSAKSGIILAP